MTDEQIEAHEKAGSDLHEPVVSKPIGAIGNVCRICGAEIMRSVVNPKLWLEPGKREGIRGGEE